MEAPVDLKTKLVGLAADQALLADELLRVRLELASRTRELQESEARFRDVIELNADAQVVVDERGIVRFANRMAARLFDRDRRELVGTSFGFPLVAGETTEVDLLSQSGPRVAEMRVVKSEWEGSTAYIASLRDVTERKHAEQADRELIREQAARTAAERAAQRLRFLLESSTVLAASLDYDTTLSALAKLCVPQLADWAVVFCLDDTGAPRRLEVAHRDPSKAGAVAALRDMPAPMSDTHPVQRALRECQPQLLRVVDRGQLDAMIHDEHKREVVRELGIESLMVVPMIARDKSLGVLELVSADAKRRFDEQDLALAEDVAARAALAVESARLYEEARRANKMKSDFLAVVSHDLRTPLTAIIGYADLLELGVPEPLRDGALERVQRIRTSARHLVYLLNELLAFARLDAGREVVRARDVDVCQIVRDVASVAEPLAQAKQLRLEVALPNASCIVSTDPDKVRQVLINLVGNAIKYTEQGSVLVEVRADGADRLRLRVKDTGVGIAPEHVKQIFEPFWQVDPAQRTRDGGTGLGLSVVKRLSELLSGSVSVESAPGKGSTFTVTLPRQQPVSTAE
jgi:signal transduction histidine kinase